MIKSDDDDDAADDPAKRKITTKEGRSMAFKWCVPYIEVSAKNGSNVVEAFHACVAEVNEFVKKVQFGDDDAHHR